MAELSRFTLGMLFHSPLIQQYLVEYGKSSSDRVLASSATFSEAVRIAKNWEAEGVEVLISRRATADILRNSVKTPVLSLPFSDIENLRSIRSNCKQGMRILVPAYKRRTPIFGLLGKTLKVIILQKIYSTELELRQLVEAAAQDSTDCVAGGHATSLLAEEYGIPYVALPPSREQIFSILESARNVAQSNRDKERLLSESQAIMNAMTEGLICIDVSGEIMSLNNRALSFFGDYPLENIIGTSFIPYIGDNIFTEIIQQKHNKEYVIEINKKTFVTHVTHLNNKFDAGLILFTLRKKQDVLRQTQAINISDSRGFVACKHLGGLIYKSEVMQKTVKLTRVYAKSDASILLIGETGTGKEILAQGIHNNSPRNNMPFVSINCAELPEQLLESELFGHEEGAFTGARKGGKAGLFELADKGTIFLDEICSSSSSVQAKLLRVLQEKELMRIGGTRKIPVNVRVIAASGQELWPLICGGSFRQDLFFRLNVLCIRLPPLRDRIDDLDVLLPSFLKQFSDREKCRQPVLSDKDIALLKNYEWPGNVRQLKNFAERLVLHSVFLPDTFSLIYEELLTISPGRDKAGPTIDEENNAEGVPSALEAPNMPTPRENPKLVLDDPQRLRKFMESVRYSKKDAADLLGVSRSTLWRKLKQWNI
ncbi:MAG: sigma 54-interacting transcriptional regulator [Desulfovibrio sp.]|nr:sigma 54-interacting transcriptional regulator [Desulfovibrio sp.]